MENGIKNLDYYLKNNLVHVDTSKELEDELKKYPVMEHDK